MVQPGSRAATIHVTAHLTLGKNMKLLPLVGIDELRFGDEMPKVIAVKGDSGEKRTNSLSYNHTSLYYGALTLGFCAKHRLNFIAVTHTEEHAELWGEQPFDIGHRSPAAYENVQDWLRHSCHAFRTHHDCFGAYISVTGQGVTFCFELPDCSMLEGIQLDLEQ